MAWQIEADLLADGRELLEHTSGSRRYRDLYPDGPNLELLLLAYQALDRTRALDEHPASPRRLRRRFRRLIRRFVREDAIARTRRLTWHLPEARPQHLPDAAPHVVQRALERVDHDVRGEIGAIIRGRDMQLASPDESIIASRGAPARIVRGLEQFREALLYEALAHPDAIARIHPQFVRFTASALPARRGHPWMRLLLVKIPFYFWTVIASASALGYFGAYTYFNDETLGAFVSSKVNGLIKGDLELESIHWQPRLVLDLVTGTPTPLVVRNVAVWEAYKTSGHPRQRRAAHASQIEVTLVLHEIIPWNRLGIPSIFEIPWILHFVDARSDALVRFDIRQYEATMEQQSRIIVGLLGAFELLDDSPDPRRGLSFAVDAGTFARTNLSLDFQEHADWSVDAELTETWFSLFFDAPRPALPAPEDAPFRFRLSSERADGEATIVDVLLPFDAHLREFQSGYDGIPYGDISVLIDGRFGGSPLTGYGLLKDFLAKNVPAATTSSGRARETPEEIEPWVELRAITPDAGPVLESILIELGLDPEMLEADDVELSTWMSGPFSDLHYRMAAQGLTFNPFDEPSWAFDDLDVSLTLANRVVPPTLAVGVPPGSARKVVEVRRFDGAVLDGSLALRLDHVAHVVMPASDSREPWVLAADLEIDGVNPAHLFVDAPDLASTVQGNLDGRLAIDRIVLDTAGDELGTDEAGVRSAAVHAHDLVLSRDHGPEQDSLPRSFRADGPLAWSRSGEVSTSGLTLSTPGAELMLRGRIHGQFDTLDALEMQLDIPDGPAFAAAFALPPVFTSASAALTLAGPLGNPSGSGGHLAVEGLGIDPMGKSGRWDGTLAFDRGTIRFRRPKASVFGGEGTIDIDLTVLEQGEFSEDPQLLARVDVDHASIAKLTDGFAQGSVDVRLDVRDDDGGPVPLSRLRARAAVFAPEIEHAGLRYREAAATLVLTREAVDIESLRLPIHRPLSPFHAPNVTVPIGEITARGRVTLDDPPIADLELGAERVPLQAVGDIIGLELPVRGQIGRGTKVRLRGSLKQPALEGTVKLQTLAVGGLPLGSGSLRVFSEDVAESAPLAAHREVRVQGEIGTHEHRGNVDWTIDAVVALGAAKGDEPPLVAAQVDLAFERFSLPQLLATQDSKLRERIQGALEGLDATLLTCNAGPKLLSDCVVKPSDRRSLAIDLTLDRVWLRHREHRAKTTDPCDDPNSLCSRSPIEASVDWPIVELRKPVRLSGGGNVGGEIEASGRFDLTPPPVATASDACDERAMGRPSSGGTTEAHIVGVVDLRLLAPLLEAAGVQNPAGLLQLGVAVTGFARAPRVTGVVQLEDARRPLELQLAGVPFPLTFPALAVEVDGGTVYPSGRLRVHGKDIDFGTTNDQRSFYAFAGPCSGRFQLIADGAIDAKLLDSWPNSLVLAASGGVDLPSLMIAGRIADEVELDRLAGMLEFRDHVLKLELAEGFREVELSRGQLEFARCTAQRPCPGGVGLDGGGGYGLFVGGRRNASASVMPETALRAEVDDRGTAHAWGYFIFDDALESIADAGLRVVAAEVPYLSHDARGRPTLEAVVSTDNLVIEGSTPLIVRGLVDIERSRWLRDAQQGVEIIGLFDDSEVPEQPPPAIVRDLHFDLDLRTVAPLRMENNIATGVAANMLMNVAGTYENPEFTGRLEVEPGGVVTVPFVSGTYEIQRGRVDVNRVLETAQVDVLAQRQEPVYINGQPREIQLILGGNLSAITWRCNAEGEAATAVATTRGCVDYLVLGAGDLQVTDAEIQQAGGGLQNARRSLQVVSSVAEIDVSENVTQAVPRLGRYIPDVGLRLGQIGPEVEVATPTEWSNFDYGHATAHWEYIRGYPGFLLREKRELTLRLQILDPMTIEYRQSTRTYLNQRIVFDPRNQTTFELRFDFEIPSLR